MRFGDAHAASPTTISNFGPSLRKERRRTVNMLPSVMQWPRIPLRACVVRLSERFDFIKRYGIITWPRTVGLTEFLSGILSLQGSILNNVKFHSLMSYCRLAGTARQLTNYLGGAGYTRDKLLLPRGEINQFRGGRKRDNICWIIC